MKEMTKEQMLERKSFIEKQIPILESKERYFDINHTIIDWLDYDKLCALKRELKELDAKLA